MLDLIDFLLESFLVEILHGLAPLLLLICELPTPNQRLWYWLPASTAFAITIVLCLATLTSPVTNIEGETIYKIETVITGFGRWEEPITLKAR